MKLLKIKNIKLDKLLVDKICRFKMKFWKYSLKSQKKFFKDNHNDEDLHFILMDKKKIIAYNALKKKFFYQAKNKKNLKKSFLLFDSFLVDKNFRSQNIGSVHLKKNNVFIKKAKKTAFLLCKKNLINFYLRNDWDLRIEKFIFIKNYKKKKNLMSLNLDKLTKTSKIIIDLK